MSSVSVRGYQVTTDHYGLAGAHPIVDQGKALICGYTDAPTLPCQLPVTVFGDHTREVKFIDFPFVVGADGTKILQPSGDQDPRYLSALIKLAADKISNLGYARHFKELKEAEVPYVTDLSEQRRIAAVLDAWDEAIVTAERLASARVQATSAMMARLIDPQLVGQRPLTSLFSSAISGCWGEEEVGGLRILRNTDFGPDGYATLDSAPARAVTVRERIKTELLKGDILLEKSGGGPDQPVGRVVRFSGIDGYGFSNFLLRLRPETSVCPDYAYYLLRRKYERRDPLLYQQQTTGIRNLEWKDYLASSVADANGPKQAGIVRVLKELEAAQAAETARADLLRRQKRGLMQKLLTGELRVPATGDALDPGGSAADGMETTE